MKRFIISAALLIAGTTTLFAQDATSVMQRYMKASNLESISTNTSLMVDMTTSVMGTEIPAKVIQEGAKMRFEMTTAGQEILVVINGEQGWVQSGGQIIALPKQQLAQMTSQGDFLKNVKWDTSKFNFTYVEEKDGAEIIKITPLVEDKNSGESVAHFDKASGMLKSLDVKSNGVQVIVAMSDYKKFGDVTIPTKMVTEMGGKTISTVTINKFEVDYPTAAYMFVEPK